MPLIAQYAAIVLTAITSFAIGTLANFSDYIVWMYEDPNRGSSIISQRLEGTVTDFYKQNMFLHKTAVELTHAMSHEQKAGQILMPAWEKGTSVDQMTALLEKYSIGGVMVLRNDATRAQVQKLKQSTVKTVGETSIQGLVSIDAEPSLLRYRMPSSGYTTKTDTLASPELAFSAGKTIAQIIASYGYNYNFAPVYDTDLNKAIIGDRAFGRDAEDIHSKASVFTKAMTENNIISTAKHFPGHGAVVGDTHKNLQIVPSDLPELEAFRAAINDRVPSVMVGHLAIEGGQYDTAGRPATLSQNVIEKLLRKDLGFKGLVITDGMNMGALDSFSDQDMQAINAGVDIVLMPRELEITHETLVERMKNDIQFEEKVNEKVYRIVRMKLVQAWADQ